MLFSTLEIFYPQSLFLLREFPEFSFEMHAKDKMIVVDNTLMVYLILAILALAMVLMALPTMLRKRR